MLLNAECYFLTLPIKYSKIESTTLITIEVASGKQKVVFFPR